MSNAQHAEALREQVRPEDRRKHTRITLKTEVHLGSESNFYTGFTNDISEGGVFISTHAVFTRGQIIDLEFSLPDGQDPIKVQAEVRWFREYNPSSDGPPGMGLQFVSLTDEQRARIDAFTTDRETLFYDD